MSKKQVYRILSIISFILGVFILLTPKANTTSAVIGVTLADSSNILFGVALLLISTILFVSGSSKLEDKVKLTSKIKDDKTLMRLAKEATIFILF